MISVFTVGITVQLVDKVSASMGVITRSLLSGQMAASALDEKMKSIKNTFSTGMVLIGGGMALAAPLIAATNEAAKLEQALKNVQVITKASNEEMKGYDALLGSVSHKTAVFSKAALADFASHMAQGGIRDSRGIQKLLPLFADAADILKLTKHMDANQVAEALTSVAHQFGKFEPDADMQKIVSNFVTGMKIAPGTVGQFVRGGAYVNPLGSRIFEIDPTSLFAMQIAAAQTSGGGGGRGALSPNNQINVIKRSMPGVFGSGLFEGKSPFALSLLGLMNDQGLSTLRTNGKFDLMKLSDKMAEFQTLGQSPEGRMTIARRMLAAAPMMGKKQGEVEQFAKNVLAQHGNVLGSEMTMKPLQFAFGSGSSFAAMLGDKAFREQMSFVRRRMETEPSLSKQQQDLSKTYTFAQIQAQTDMGSLMADVGKRLLPHATKLVRAFDTMIMAIDNFVNRHPRITNAIVGITAGLSGLLIAGGVGLLLKAAGMGLGLLLTPLAAIVPEAMALLACLGPVGWAVMGLTAVIGTGLMLAITHWKDITIWFANASKQASDALAGFGNTAIAFINKISGLHLPEFKTANASNPAKAAGAGGNQTNNMHFDMSFKVSGNHFNEMSDKQLLAMATKHQKEKEKQVIQAVKSVTRAGGAGHSIALTGGGNN